MAQNDDLKYMELKPRQLAAIPHVVTAKSTAEAARLADVSRNTLYRWMRDPAFRTTLENYRREAAQLARVEMSGLLLKAVATLSDVMDSPDQRARTDAARTIVYASLKTEEYKELANRLDSVSNAVALRNEREPFPFK